MTSPDISNYVDLTIYDRQPVEIYDDALEYARVALPEFDPQTGSVEDAIIQCMARMTGELAGAINRVPSSVVEALLQLFDIQRLTGSAPTGTVTFTAIDDLGYTVPVGTRIGYLDSSDPSNPILYTFDTVADAVILQGETTADVAVIGTSLLEYPPLISGTSLRVVTPLSFLNGAQLADELNRGEDPESDTAYFTRAMARLNSFSAALVLPSQYQSYILSAYPDVYRCQAFTLTNPTNTNWDASPQNGYLTIFACRASGVALTGAAMNTIETDVTDRSVAGVSITVAAPTIVNVPVTVTVTSKAGYAQGAVIAAVQAALATYLHPNYWDWSQTIYHNEVIALIDRVEGVNRVVSLSFDATEGQSYLNGSNLSFVQKGSLPLATTTVTVA